MSEAFARRYRLQNRIAIGGTAEVFRALYLMGDGQERPVVIKRILPQFARDQRFRRLFHEEACVAVTMSHPSIVRVLDHGDLGPTCYIALELVEGMDLGSLLAAAARAGQPPSPRLASYIAAQVAEALEFIHAQTSSEGTPLQIIHRDVSPQNILVSYTGDVKLTDFGIAKSAIRRDQTVDGTLRGKLDYMSPEQASLGPVDHRADIFALGCVLYEMLEGTPPFRGENELDTLERVRAGRIRVEPATMDIPPALRLALTRALAPLAAERYQHASQMAEDLRGFLTEAGAPEPENLGRWVRELQAVPEPAAGSRLDEAVRRLLGDDGAATAPGTAVFAAAADELQRPADRPARSRPGGQRRQVVLGILVLLGLAGTLLWVLGRDRSVAGSQADARQQAPDRTQLLPDAAARPLDQPPGQRLLLGSQPAGASVSVDGEPVGRTPLELPRPARAILLELQKEGFRPWRRRLEPGSLAGSLQISLQPLLVRPTGQSFLTINTLPWSRVRVDGRVVGNTPLVRLPVRAGNHRVELLGPAGELRKVLSVTLAAGASRSFTFDFTR